MSLLGHVCSEDTSIQGSQTLLPTEPSYTRKLLRRRDTSIQRTLLLFLRVFSKWRFDCMLCVKWFSLSNSTFCSSYRGWVLILTFFAYASYHLSRKPISVVKVRITKLQWSGSHSKCAQVLIQTILKKLVNVPNNLFQGKVNVLIMLSGIEWVFCL